MLCYAMLCGGDDVACNKCSGNSSVLVASGRLPRSVRPFQCKSARISAAVAADLFDQLQEPQLTEGDLLILRGDIPHVTGLARRGAFRLALSARVWREPSRDKLKNLLRATTCAPRAKLIRHHLQHRQMSPPLPSAENRTAAPSPAQPAASSHTVHESRATRECETVDVHSTGGLRLNLRRAAALVHAGPTDDPGAVPYSRCSLASFDAPGPERPQRRGTQIGPKTGRQHGDGEGVGGGGGGEERYPVRSAASSKCVSGRECWQAGAALRVHHDARHLPPARPLDGELLLFMRTQCAFDTMHADGSFLDHLSFCADYAYAHMPGSSRVLLLHSILGTSANYFPMQLRHLPRLKELVSPDELVHLRAFPAVQRLIYATDLLCVLWASRAELHSLRHVSFHQVRPLNEPLSLDAHALLQHLNFQLIHQVDFMPACCWAQPGASAHDSVDVQAFVRLWRFLFATGNLVANVTLRDSTTTATAVRPGCRALLAGGATTTEPTWQHRAPEPHRACSVPDPTTLRASARLGHKLNFSLVFL